MKKFNGRRQFLKNLSLSSVAMGFLPVLSNCKTPDIKEKKEEFLGGCDQTTRDYYGEGPFYTDNPPTIQENQLAAQEEPGTRMLISGRIYNLECSQFLPNVLVDVWHANHAGEYDNEGYNLRGQTYSNEQGFYMFETIKPGKYLNGAQYRPSHIHFKITPPDHPVLTTQLYFEGDTDIPADAAASINSGQYDASHRIIPLFENNEGKMEGTWDIVIDGAGVTGNNDLHIDKGMIYNAGPNPFQSDLLIRYGVFKKSKVGLMVFNLEGKAVAVLEDATLASAKYEALWKPDASLSNGHYFVVLRINDLQVHHMKVQLKR